MSFRFIHVPLLVCLWAASIAASAQGVTIFAAASLTDAVNDIVKMYVAKSGVGVKSSYAASSALARQIESGAQADLFFSADEEWMDYLDKRSLIDKGTRFDRLGNRLVLIAPAGAARKVEIRRGIDLAGLLAGGRLATGDPASVPVGRYARQALTYLGVWAFAEAKLARADNVRFALTYVERGEAPLGIVYSTDAAIARGVQVIGVFPQESHSPINYPIAIVAGRGTAAVRAFHGFILGSEAAAVFQRFGFAVR